MANYYGIGFKVKTMVPNTHPYTFGVPAEFSGYNWVYHNEDKVEEMAVPEEELILPEEVRLAIRAIIQSSIECIPVFDGKSALKSLNLPQLLHMYEVMAKHGKNGVVGTRGFDALDGPQGWGGAHLYHKIARAVTRLLRELDEAAGGGLEMQICVAFGEEAQAALQEAGYV